MDMDSLGKPLIDGAALIISGGAGWIANTAKEKVKDQDRKIEDIEKDHNKFQVIVANDYAKNVTLAAITSRIDSTLSEIQRDIKTLLQR